ncbi:GGDEF domain-containing protein [Pelagibacterium luteolum]|uniref:diguanylate cyclase n=1 Tax=Pelagibacterium luteolum TaxID=440168 RepID=A0A1G7WR25_9HYPH|nr:GGDEF domain-containing protein [Pelagibacterium luteolum]SDG74356.1 diguanylate cyclase (GGDEF) domain-containing protein [Pelagibacterium luteolum]
MHEAVLARSSRTDTITIYEWISRLAHPKSFMGKLFLICFFGTHVPLIGFSIFIVFATEITLAEIWPQMLVLLLATIAAFATTLFLVHHLLAPVRLVSGAMETYVKTRALPKLPLHHADDMGLMMRNVQSALEELDFAIRTTDAKANVDFLTGLGNKRWLNTRGAFAFDLARRRNEKLSVIVFDIDHFKTLNDTYGHASGDIVLKDVGEFVREHVRPQDIVGRIGGEEFCILAVGCDRLEAAAIAERIRSAFFDHGFQLPGLAHVTASFGVAEMKPEATTLDDVIAAADNALYEAKEAGRDRVMCAA